jgi:uncharacterized protein (DUF4415 family)
VSTTVRSATSWSPSEVYRRCPAEQPDSEIDFSDLAPLNESFWKNAVRNPFYRPVKQQLTVRLDADVVVWLRQQRRGYQTRLNRVLREAMLEDIKNSA